MECAGYLLQPDDLHIVALLDCENAGTMFSFYPLVAHREGIHETEQIAEDMDLSADKSSCELRVCSMEVHFYSSVYRHFRSCLNGMASA